jgi:ketosteroid isomerase-like protein
MAGPDNGFIPLGHLAPGWSGTRPNRDRATQHHGERDNERTMSQEDVEIVRRLLGPFEQDDLIPLFRDDAISASITAASAPFLTPDFECVFVREDVGRAAYSGPDGLRAGFLDWLSPWESYHGVVEDVIDARDGRVLVLTRDHARPKGANAEVYFVGAPVWTVRDGKVARIEFYWNRAEALAAAGLSN